MRYLASLVLLILVSIESFGQAGITLSGKVVESGSNEPIGFATVAIMDPDTHKPVTGVTTQMDGTFEVNTKAASFYLEVSFIGFEKRIIKDLNTSSSRINLGNIVLSVNEQQLDEIVIEGEKSSTEFRIDKRVFNVGADLSTAGASALDVLGNVPSVNVNIEGAVSLRGSTGVQILIDGKPSVLTSSDDGNALGTITADMIESVEVITNPSAKYEAEGTSGIINIILKKEEKKGTNGSISLNTGVPHNHSVGLSLNHRTEKLNLFSQLGVGYRQRPNKKKSVNHSLLTDTIISSTGKEYKNEQFYNFILGADYYLNEFNILTLSGNFALEIEDQPSETDYSMTHDGEMLSEWNRKESTKATNPKYQFELQYKRDFEDDEDHDLLFSAIGSFFGKTQSSDFTNVTTAGASLQDAKQKTATSYSEGKYTFKMDYTKPFSESLSMEAGAQYLINDVGNDYSVENLTDDEWELDESQTNNFEYNQNVLGVYATGAYELSKWGLKLGLRVENTDLSTLLINTGEGNDRNYNNLFPSAHASYKLSKTFSLQSGYSRRIYRPRLWDLNPFFNLRDNYNIQRGNPDLQPEFTDSYEIGSVFNGSNISLSTAIYHRYTTSVIEDISFYEDNVNVTQPENIGTNHASGLEVSGKYEPAKWVTINLDFNYNYYDRKGELEGTTIDFQADQWTSKLNGKFKLPADIDFEVTGNYRSSYETVQGDVEDMIYMDLGARKKILKGKGVVNLSVRDLFASRIEQTNVYQSTYELYSRSLRGTFFTLGFSYGFGKGEAMTYSGGKR